MSPKAPESSGRKLGAGRRGAEDREVRVALRLVRDRARVLQDRRVGVDDGGVRVEAQGRREARDAPVRVME